MQWFDVIVVGLGAMGSAAADHLAARGRRVLGLDRYRPPHTLGSSHGRTRIIREAYFEHPAYVPLVQRAYENWSRLEHDTGQRLLLQTGGLMIGPPQGVLVQGATSSARQHHLTYETLSAEDIRKKFPAYHPSDDMVAIWEPRAGVLFVEKCIEAQLQRAHAQGATLRYEEPVSAWRVRGDGVEVTTPQGKYQAEKVVFSAGPWLEALVPALRLPLTVERQVQFWFKPRAHAQWFSAQNFPVFIWEYEPDRFFYGFPDLGDGVKAAFHHEGRLTTAGTAKRDVEPHEAHALHAVLARRLPQAAGELLDSAACLYTNTPDTHFLIDFHPGHPHVLIASACSGHGFKFASAIGEALADLLIEGRSRFDLGLFRRARLK